MANFVKRLISIGLAIGCLTTCIGAANVESVDPTADKTELYLDYPEFYANQQYYKDLARTENYRLIIHVGEEYAELEEARIAEESTTVNQLVENPKTRGANPPTREWNILDNGTYNFEGIADYSPVYTNYYITGWTSYEVSVYNNWDKYTAIGFAYNVRGANGARSFVCLPESTVIEYFPANSTSHFYLSFDEPADVEGYIAMDY